MGLGNAKILPSNATKTQPASRFSQFFASEIMRIFITSANEVGEVLFSPLFVCLFVCLFFCLFVGLFVCL